MPAKMSAERKAEIRRIMSCVPFIEPDAGVVETQQAICDLLDYVEELEGRTPPAPPDPVRARLVEALRAYRSKHANDWADMPMDIADREDCPCALCSEARAALAAAEGEGK